MKQTVVSMLVATTTASWGEWDRQEYCDFNQDKIDTENISSDYYYTTEECSYFCETTDQSNGDIAYGDGLCCDFEAWEDGSYDCTLYKGRVTLENGYVAPVGTDGTVMGNDFQSMTFSSGDYRYGPAEYVENVKNSMIDAGCGDYCVADLFAGNSSNSTNITALAEECGCPEFMLQWNDAQTSTLSLQDAEPETPAPEGGEAPAPEGGETPAPEGEEAGGSKTPLMVGGIGIVALIAGLVKWKMSSSTEEEGGTDFDPMGAYGAMDVPSMDPSMAMEPPF